jgi:predicted CoA-substrate-specific enzyme activase
MHTLGLNIGSSTIKAVLMDEEKILWHKTSDHEGDFISTVKNLILNSHIPSDTKMLVTGTEGRYLINSNNVIESVCVEEAIRELEIKADAVVSLGGENFIVYLIDENGRIITSFSGNKCASGTGEFFKQQLGRMDMTLHDIHKIPDTAKPQPLSTRCSVFMKSDCTHKLNKGEATKADIVLSLSDVMATKVADFLKKARIEKGNVVLCGGVTRNSHMIELLKKKLPGINIIIPQEAIFFEAFGAALMARRTGSDVPRMDMFFKKYEAGFGRYPSLSAALGRVKYIEAKRGKIKPGREYILGIDGGSTTTKVALIDMETDEIWQTTMAELMEIQCVHLKNALRKYKTNNRTNWR